MDAYDFWTSLRELLTVTARAHAFEHGTELNVGETFQLELTVRNASSATQSTLGHIPLVVFKNVRLSIRGTDYAVPVGSTEIDVSPALAPGKEQKLNVGYRAISYKTGTAEQFQEALIATVSVSADLDQDKFFKIRRRSSVSEVIEP